MGLATPPVAGGSALFVRHLMRAIIILITFFALSFTGRAQLVNTFIVSSNDVVQGSIFAYHVEPGTNDTRLTVKFAFTDAGAKRLKDFYQAHTVGDDVYWQSGGFVHPFKLDDRKFFGREGFWGLPEQDAKALMAGLRGDR
jgi:hypothetical protein